MIPGDFCRCLGENCERKDQCERHIALSYKNGPRFISQSKKMCGWTGDPRGHDYFIKAHKGETK